MVQRSIFQPAVVLLALGATLWAGGIELKDVPHRIALPLDPGRNEIITAVVPDAGVKAVWAAVSADSRQRVALSNQGAGSYQLNLGDSKLVEMLRETGAREFHIFAELETGSTLSSAAIVCVVAAAPHLTLPPGGAKLVVKQRQSKSIPGSDQSVHISVDDVTAGQVFLEIRTADGKSIVDQRSVREGAEVPFRVGGSEYVLLVQKLQNVLVGDDWVELLVTTPAENEKQKIESAIVRIETSGLTFIRNGEEHSAADAAAHLRTKLKSAGDKIQTFDGFVEGIASKSSMSGKPYLVKQADGTTVELAKWLRSDDPPKQSGQSPSQNDQ